jgi:hypothetical protein
MGDCPLNPHRGNSLGHVKAHTRAGQQKTKRISG